MLDELKDLVMARNAGKENGLTYSYAELFGLVSGFLTETELQGLIDLVKQG